MFNLAFQWWVGSVHAVDTGLTHYYINKPISLQHEYRTVNPYNTGVQCTYQHKQWRRMTFISHKASLSPTSSTQDGGYYFRCKFKASAMDRRYKEASVRPGQSIILTIISQLQLLLQSETHIPHTRTTVIISRCIPLSLPFFYSLLFQQVARPSASTWATATLIFKVESSGTTRGTLCVLTARLSATPRARGMLKVKRLVITRGIPHAPASKSGPRRQWWS